MTLGTGGTRAIEAAGGLSPLRWAAAGAIVAGAYATAIWLALSLPEPDGAQGELDRAVMIELEPMTAAAEAPPPAPAPAPEPVPEPVEEVAETPPPPVEEPPPPVEEALPEPPPPEPPEPEAVQPPEPLPEPPPPPEEIAPEPMPEPEPVPLPEPVNEPALPPKEVARPEPLPEEIVPELPESSDTTAAILNAPIPTARPTPPRPRAEPEKPRETRRAERRERTPEPRQQRRTERRQANDSQAESRAAQQRRATAPRMSQSQWNSLVRSQIVRAGRRVAGRPSGRAIVSFTVDAGGRIRSPRLAQSSGDGALDREAVATVRRAGRVPPPPPGSAGAPISVPIKVN